MTDNYTVRAVGDMGVAKDHDAAWKQLLVDRQILSRIMKECMHEFKDVSIEDIETKYIEGEPLIDVVPVFDVSPVVKTKNIEDNSIREGNTKFDILVDAIAPPDSDPIKLIINIEPQGRHSESDYPLLKRAIYYCSRLISSQKKDRFENDNYGKLQKVYSIWLCTDPPLEKRNTLTEYHFTENNMYGNVKANRLEYDLIDIIFICLDPKSEPSENYLIKLFNIIKDQRLQISEKTDIMSNEYEMDVTPDLESEVFNLGDSIGMSLLQSTFEEGVEKGISQGSEEKAIEIAKKLLAKNLDIDLISECSGLPVEQVRELAASL